MYKQSTTLSLLLSSVSAGMLRYPATEGKFFYMGLDHEVDPTTFDLGEYANLYHANLFVGSAAKKLELWVSTAEHQMGVFEHDCGNCDLNGGWDPSSSTTAGGSEVHSPFIEASFVYNHDNEGKSLYPNTFVGL